MVGETIETDDKLLIPITRMGMGFGAGMGEGKGSDDMSGAGAGAGGAAGIEPIAVIVVFKGVSGPEGVKVMSLKAPDPLTRAIGIKILSSDSIVSPTTFSIFKTLRISSTVVLIGSPIFNKIPP